MRISNTVGLGASPSVVAFSFGFVLSIGLFAITTLAGAAAVTLFTDDFEQSGSGMTRGWGNANITGSSDPTRDVSAGVSGKGLSFDGSTSANPDDATERHIATKGLETITVSYALQLNSMSGDSFVVSYYLDGVLNTSDTLSANQATTTMNKVLANTNRATRLTVRFTLNADDNGNDKARVDNITVSGDGQPALYFFDGLETKNFSAGGWTTAGDSNDAFIDTDTINATTPVIWTDDSAAPDGSSQNTGYSARLRGGSDPDGSMIKAISTVGYQNIHIRYARRVDNMDASEGLRVSYSTDGTTFTNEIEARFDNTAYGTIKFDFPASANNNANFAVKFDVESNSNGEEAWIDDVVIWGAVAPQNPTVSVTNSPVTYTGSAQSAAVSGSVSGTVSDIKYDGSATAPTDVGTYAVTADFAPTDTGTYNSLDDASAGNFVINQATSVTTVTCPASQVYTGFAQTPCSATVTGAGGLSLTPTPNHSANTDVGTASASYTYAGDTNHSGSTDSENFSITAAPLTIVGMLFGAQEYDGTTDAHYQDNGGTLTGILNGDDVSANLGAGTYTFASPNVGDDKPVTVAGITLGGTKADNYSLTQPTDVTVDVTPRVIAVAADAKGKTYGDSDPSLTYGVTGTLVGADTFSGSLTRDVGEDVGTYPITQGSLALGSNYQLNFTGNSLAITPKEFLTVTADNQTITYGDAEPTFTFQYSGFVNGDVAGDVDIAPTCSVAGAHTDANTYSIVCSGGSDANYDFSYDSGTLTINKAAAVIVVTPYSVTYDANSHVAMGTATGVASEDLSSQLDLSGTTHTNAGTYNADMWTFTDITGNYNNDSDTITNTITKASSTITVDAYTVTFDGNAHMASGTVKGVVDENLSGLDLSATSHTAVGVYTGDPWTFTDVTGNYLNDSGTVDNVISAIVIRTLTYVAGANGSVTGDALQSVVDGGNGTTVTAVANSGFHFLNWSDASTTNPRTDTAVAADITVTANFEADAPAPSSGGGGGGGGGGNGAPAGTLGATNAVIPTTETTGTPQTPNNPEAPVVLVPGNDNGSEVLGASTETSTGGGSANPTTEGGSSATTTATTTPAAGIGLEDLTAAVATNALDIPQWLWALLLALLVGGAGSWFYFFGKKKV